MYLFVDIFLIMLSTSLVAGLAGRIGSGQEVESAQRLELAFSFNLLAFLGLVLAGGAEIPVQVWLLSQIVVFPVSLLCIQGFSRKIPFASKALLCAVIAVGIGTYAYAGIPVLMGRAVGIYTVTKRAW